MSKFAYTETIKEAEIFLQGDEFHHQVKVLRRKKGDRIELLDGRGGLFYGLIESIGRDRLQVKITGAELKTEPRPLHLLVALPRNEKFDNIIEKAVELGVTRITPLITAHTMVKSGSAPKSERKIVHWRKIAISSLKQSGSLFLPEIDSPTLLSKINLCGMDTGDWQEIVFHPQAHEEELTLDRLNFSSDCKTRLFLGPEGGFCKEEIDFFRFRNCSLSSLGSRILRLETAVVAALVLIQFLREKKSSLTT